MFRQSVWASAHRRSWGRLLFSMRLVWPSTGENTNGNYHCIFGTVRGGFHGWVRMMKPYILDSLSPKPPGQTILEIQATYLQCVASVYSPTQRSLATNLVLSESSRTGTWSPSKNSSVIQPGLTFQSQLQSVWLNHSTNHSIIHLRMVRAGTIRRNS